MSHSFLADLARRVSLHPSCRAELRHHWPAPHYHKTPQDVAAEAEEMRRRHAARAASTADAGNASSSVGDAAAAARDPFNPFEHFRVRKRSHRRRRRRQRPDGSQPPVPDTETAKKDSTTAITSVDAAPRSSINISSSGGGGARATALTTSAEDSKPAAATAPPAARRASLMFPAKRIQQVSRRSGRKAQAGTAATATREAASAPTQTSSSTSPGTTTAASPASKQPARRSDAAPSKKESERNHSGSQTNSKAAAVSKSGSSSSSSCSSASRSGSADTRRDSDLDSDELEPCHDPLHIRLPRTPAHPTTSGVSRPLRVTVRWSGAAQRRRRHVRQLQKRNRSETDFAPRREITMTPSGFEMAKSETSPAPSDLHQQQQQQHQQGQVYRVPAGSAMHAAKMTAAAEEDEDDHESHILRSCSSDMKGQGEETSPTRPPAASVMAGGGGVSASASVATSHSLRPPSTVDEVCLLGCDTRVEVRPAQHQHQQQQQQQHASAGSASAVGSSAHTRSSGRSQGPQAHPSTATAAATEEVEGRYHRQPARKSTTIFSQSTTTAPRTSLLGVTSSELPTPASSAAEPYAVSSPHSYLRRPNSLLIVRSPPQESCADDVLTASSGVFYYSCPGAFSRGGGPTTAPAGLHGLQGGNQLRVTYVTNNANRGGTTGNGSSTLNSNDVSFTAEGTASASQTARGRGLAHAPRPYALTLGGQNYPDALGGCANNGSSTFSHVRSHSGSPTTVVVPSSSGGHTNAATGANVSSHITPPSSLPSTPLVTTAATATTTAAAAAATGQQSPPPQALSMKAVLGQRRRSSLLRQQQAQQQAQQQQYQRQRSPLHSFFPSPEAVAAHLIYQKRATRTAPPQLQRVESAASSTADTVAFTPLNVMVGTVTSSPAHSPLVLQGPSAVDGAEHSPLPTAAKTRLDASASPFDVAQSAKQTLSTSSVNLHDDPQLLSDHPGYAFTPLHPQRDLSGLSTIGGGSSLRPTRLSHPYFSHTDVPPTNAYTGGAGNSFGHGGAVGGDANGMGSGGDSFGAAPLRMSGSLPATPHQATAPQSLSFATAMWVDGGDTEPHGSTLLHPLQHASQQQQQQQGKAESPLGPWACARPCFYAPSENSAWIEHTRHGAATPTAALTPMLPVPSIYNGHYNANNMYSEPATPMLTPQLNQHQLQYPYASQQPQRHPSASPQHTFTYSAMSTPHVSHLLPPAAQRTRSGLMRGAATASNASPVMPEVFCKFQRSDAQRLRRRAPPLPPGTECPGMAGRLAYEAYRDAVRRGLVKEEEECSYYLSHHHFSPVPSPMAGSAAGRGSGSVAGTNDTQEDRASAASPPSTRASEAPQRSQPGRPAAATRPLCVVSLADLRATPSPRASRKPQQHAASSPPKPQDSRTPLRHHSVEMEEVDDQRSRSSSSSVAQQSSEWGGETWNGPRLLFQIPRCCDDPYHRDEEALEMMSITTASSCAFGAGLDGLAWREWMPSSPVEAGEEVLRTFAAAAAKASAAAAARSGSPSGSARVHNSSHVSTTLSGSMHGGQLPCGTHGVSGGGLGTLGGTSFVVPSAVGTTCLSANANPPLSGSLGGPAALVAPLTPLDIAAPRNADDINDDSDVAEGITGAQRHHRTETGGQSISSATASGLAASGATGASGKRPFIAEWLVSKLQKHLEKKKLKKLQRQQAREAATVTAVYGGGTPPTSGESVPSTFLTEVQVSRDTADARRTGTTTASTVSDYSDASSHHSSSGIGGGGNMRSSQQQQQQQSPTPELIAQERLRQHQRLAYLAAAYQTELIIYEQKRRETLANRRGIQAVVDHSRARMTPEAAAAGYIYEAHACGADNSHHHQHLLHPQQQQQQQEQHVFTLAGSPKQPKDVTDVPDSVSSDSYSSVYSQAVVSVASPVATEEQEKAETITVAPRPVAAADNEPFGTEAAPPHLQPPQQRQEGTEQRRGSPMRVVKARGVAERVEAERRRVALDTVRTKQKSIETWIRAMRRQF